MFNAYVTVRVKTNSRMSEDEIEDRARQVAEDIMSSIENVDFTSIEVEGEDEYDE